MKKAFYALMIASMFSFAANAQTETMTNTGTITRTNASGTTTTAFRQRNNIDSTTVVKDSLGVRMTYSDWHTKIITGQYLLKAVDPSGDSAKEFTLLKMDEASKARFASMRPKIPVDESGLIKTGAKFDLFKMKDIDGHKLDPKELRGKVVVMNFWFIKCAPCRDEMPELNKIAKAFENNPNVVFIAVALDQKDDIKEFLKTTPFTYHIVDDGKEFAALYEIRSYPTNVIVGKDGNVKLHTMGYGPYTLDDFQKTIDAELK